MDGAADAELSLARTRRAFEDITFHPAILRDVSVVDMSVDVLLQYAVDHNVDVQIGGLRRPADQDRARNNFPGHHS